MGGLWDPDLQCRIHEDSPVFPILSRINPIPYIDTHFFKICSNITGLAAIPCIG
jgi:hypothetical protein